MIQSVSGKGSLWPRRVTICRCDRVQRFLGSTKENGRLLMGCMRVSINRLAPDGDNNNRDYLSYSAHLVATDRTAMGPFLFLL